MQYFNKLTFIIIIFAFMSGCTVRDEDLRSWVGVPVEQLDTHSLFLTMPLTKTHSASGVEIRVYANKVNINSCLGTGKINKNGYRNSTSFNTFQNCNSTLSGCDNIFYIKDSKVVQYKPVGSCYTNKTLQPEWIKW